MVNWQRIWNDDGSGILLRPVKAIAYALSLFYHLVINLRNRLYDAGIFPAVKLPCPVISVGNITVGGTGKTPTVIMLARQLSEKGWKPAILSRGYGGSSSHSVNVVADGKKILLSAKTAGDEPLLIAETLKDIPVLTGTSRIATGRAAVEKYGANVLLCDDAFQHRRIYRDINLVLLDSAAPLGNGYLLPRGSLREPSAALKRADALILTRVEENVPADNEIVKLAQINQTPLFRGRHVAREVIRREREMSLPLTYLAGKKVCAFCGIAQPQSFKKMIGAAGAQIASLDIFPDHHRYEINELEGIINKFTESGADFILTTEKDGARLTDFPEFLKPIYLLRIAMEIIPDSRLWDDFIEELLKNRTV
ncbi:MAG TPA: tetraacyldisaccharide 4'-kinase [Smithellaceae bacterium]|nr:tetraacyldisaccharide 4'-kinase [Smithellaceae bacterium]